ncbi:hypothetical protein ACFY40_11570 [Streptomyces sp. NPDC012950]|uniref:hypothetical protein n=1 Tax=Streptomyces sp. NPDC012950 TaxID=3364858 RepID=UPI0036C3E354
MTQPPPHDPPPPAWGQPSPYGPPPPPKKKLGTGAIIAIVLGSILALLVFLGVLGAIVGDPAPTTDKPSSPPPAPTTSSTPTTPSRTPTPAPTTIEPEPTTAPPTTKPAPTTPPPATSAPPAPPAEPDEQAFLEALNAIDPRIIKAGKEDQAVSRGINQCSSIQTTKDEAKLAQLALDRFTVTTRLPEIANQETGRRINHAARTHLCPSP